MEENKMGVMPIGKLIVTMSLPIMISMLVQALYNVVDSVFVARIDEYALTAYHAVSRCMDNISGLKENTQTYFLFHFGGHFSSLPP